MINKYYHAGVPTQYTPTQRMIESLIIQSIQITGFQVYYIPRNWINVDTVFTEDNLSTFTNAFPIEMYLDNAQGFEGKHEFMSKFGIEFQDSCRFTVSKQRWEKEVGRTGNAVLSNRPTEGDIIYFPLSNTVFEIKKVNALDPFYQLGKLFVYKIDCEIFQYSSERFQTGIANLDGNPYLMSQAQEEYILFQTDDSGLLLQNGTNLVLSGYDLNITSLGSQNDTFATEADAFIDWDDSNPFAEMSK